MKASSRIAISFTAALIVFGMILTGCAPYSSSYRAVAFVHSNTSHEAFMSFYEFEGRMVFQLKVDEGDTIEGTAKLGSGNASVFAYANGKRLDWSRQSMSESGTELLFEPKCSGKVFIIVETSEKCENGDFRFTVNENNSIH